MILYSSDCDVGNINGRNILTPPFLYKSSTNLNFNGWLYFILCANLNNNFNLILNDGFFDGFKFFNLLSCCSNNFVAFLAFLYVSKECKRDYGGYEYVFFFFFLIRKSVKQSNSKFWLKSYNNESGRNTT